MTSALGRGLATPPLRWRQPMVSRDVTTSHRASTNLELLFDLTFVVAVAQAAHALAEHLIDGHVGAGVVGYLAVFFAIWWAWVNFSWFASAYDTDDVLYRLLTLVQMAGVLVLAAGVPKAFSGDFQLVVLGYIIMRAAMIVQWLRAASSDPQRRPTCLRYAAGIGAVQVLWLLRLFLPHTAGAISFIVLVVLEVSVPYWSERPGMTYWHPGHIADRYAAFTIIVLGEGIAQVGAAFQTAFTAGGVTGSLTVTAVEGLVVLFAMWWAYFGRESGDALRDRSQLAFFWGYAHYFIFAAVAAVAAGIDVGISSLDAKADHVELSAMAVVLVVAVPVAVFLLMLGVMMGVLHGDLKAKMQRVVVAAAATILFAFLATSLPLPVVGALTTLPILALVVEEIVVADRHAREQLAPAQRR